MKSFIARTSWVLLLVFLFATSKGQTAADTNPETRLPQIIAKLKAPGASVAPLATEAIRLCGFAIRSEEGTVVAEPLSPTRYGLAVTDAEIRFFGKLYQSGNRVKLSEFVASFDLLYKRIGGQGSMLPFVQTWLQTGMSSPDPTRRDLVRFLTRLASAHDRRDDVLFDANTELDPIQTLLIGRVISEDLAHPIRKKIRPLTEAATFASLDFQSIAAFELPGWAEDAYAGTVGNLVGQAIEFLESVADAGGKVSKGVEIANLCASILKFIATYALLDVKLEVEEPGQPLVRTKDSAAGGRRKIKASFQISANAAADWLKENRKMLIASGVDVDMPKPGPLAGIQANFEIDQSQYSSKNHLIQTVGAIDISKVVSDKEGVARITVEGTPQRVKLDPNKVDPVMKKVKISVTPQIKSTEMNQDIVDAVFGAIGIRSGPSGLVGPIMEILYRMKWKGTKWMNLQVKDWIPFETYGTITMEIHEEGSYRGPNSYEISRINQTFEAREMEVESSGGEQTTDTDSELPKEVVALMTAAQKQQYAKERKAAEEAKKNEAKSDNTMYWVYSGPGQVAISVANTLNYQGIYTECDTDITTGSRTKIGSGSWLHPKELPEGGQFQLAIEFDPDTNQAKVVAFGTCKGKLESVRTTKGETKSTSVEGFLAFGEDVTFSTNTWIIPAKRGPESTATSYSYTGAASIPITFGTNQRFKGNMIISFSFVRKPKGSH